MSKKCYHCGLKVQAEEIRLEDKSFCCNGCKTVFEILHSQNLGDYYSLNKNPGVRPESQQNSASYAFLDSEKIFSEFVDFSSDGTTVVSFSVPAVHCTSCVWLLESLEKIYPPIVHSSVDFNQKTVRITYDSSKASLSEIAKFLADLGYKPNLSLDQSDAKEKKSISPTLYQMVVAGFCFGNVMLLTFPEYITSEGSSIEQYKDTFRYLSFLLSLPVFFYSSKSYFQSAYVGFKHKHLNIDVPISIGIVTLFVRSVYEVFSGVGAGYFDSLCGLLFFMLAGKLFQESTYKSLRFDRDYKSFYPIAVERINKEKEEYILLEELKVGDVIRVRNQEIFPSDCILLSENANIDNSFITGESKQVSRDKGELIYAGGKLVGSAVLVQTQKAVNQGYLTSLWNHQTFSLAEDSFQTLIDSISKRFTIVVLFVAFAAAFYWWFVDFSKVFQVFCSVLIVACPCALSLSTPFTLGHMLRYLGFSKWYFKDLRVLEKLNQITHIVWDKTGTLTQGDKSQIKWTGFSRNATELSTNQKQWIFALVRNSTHPLSSQLYGYLKNENSDFSSQKIEIENFQEIPGKGLVGQIQGQEIKVGSSDFLDVAAQNIVNVSSVYVQIDGVVLGYFSFQNMYRENLTQTLKGLSNFKMSVISGDNPSEKENLEKMFPLGSEFYFNQSPKDKLDYVENLQKSGEKVLMIGDGLNDSGALKESFVGLSVSDSSLGFTPSCDGIVKGEALTLAPVIFNRIKKAMGLVKIAFGFSLFYNFIGLVFAVTGHLKPVVAAILMPISSISIVLIATFGTYFINKRGGEKVQNQ
ncbi:MAG: heavy metal translocating P-type ATPase [Flavobacteriaceae bacterium]|nr:MAG: heavy metal translocating P-type ATPase [Flavobacteriaceae bacterium]